MLFELRPLVLETQGLAPAIEVFLERRQKDIEAATRLDLKLAPDNPTGEIPRLDEKVETTIFAIVQETVNNAIKHAKADNIVVGLRESVNSIVTTISDDGQGFDVDKVMNNYEERGSLGMVNIRERAELIGGDLSIDSSPGKGTEFVLTVPKAKEVRLRRRSGTGTLSLRNNMLSRE
jgi:signal transduction histidine kinase